MKRRSVPQSGTGRCHLHRIAAVLALFALQDGCARVAEVSEQAVRTATYSIQAIEEPVFLASDLTGRTQPIEVTFWFQNNATKSVRLNSGQRNCNCFDVTIPAQELKAGATAELVAKLRPQLSVGKRTVSFSVLVTPENGKGNDELKAAAEVVVLPDLAVEPSHLTREFGNEARSDVPIAITYRTKRNAGPTAPAFEVTVDDCPSEIRVSPPSPFRRVALQNGIAEYRSDSVLHISNSARLEHGLHGQLAVHVDGGQTTKLWYNVGRKRGVICAPTHLLFTGATVDAPNVRSVLLRARDSKPFAVLDVKSNHPDFQVQPFSSKGSMVHHLSIAFVPKSAGRATGKIAFTTTHETDKLIELQVTGSTRNIDDE